MEEKDTRVLRTKEVGKTLDLCYHPYNLVRFLFGTPSLLPFQFFVIVFYTCIIESVDSISRDGPDCPYM